MHKRTKTNTRYKTPPGPEFLEALPKTPDPIGFLTSLRQRYGDVVRFETVYDPYLFFNHPEHVKEIVCSENFRRIAPHSLVLGDGLLTSNGNYWRQNRKLAQPAFRQNRVPQLASVATEMTETTMAEWQRLADEKEPVDITVEMTTLTLKIIAKTLYSIDLGDQAKELVSAITLSTVELGKLTNSIYSSSVSIRNMPFFRNERFEAAVQTIDDFAYGLIANRRSVRDQPDDLLALLLSTRSESTGEALTERQLRDEIVTLLVAGHETTSLVLSWAWYLLANHPNVESRLHEEWDRVLGGRNVSLEDLDDLKYTRAVIDETMRLYPPVWSLARRAAEDYELDGYFIPANGMVIFCFYLVHRHPDYWDYPEQFFPERFTEEKTIGRSSLAYMPFLGGHHDCLGKRLALVESVFLLAGIGQRFRVRPVSKDPVKPDALLTLRLKNGLVSTIEQRANA